MFEPRNADYESVVRESVGRQTLLRTLGARLVHLAPGEVDFELDYSPEFCQQNGFVHAGAISTIADSANGYAAFTLCAPGTDVLAVEFKINLLAPANARRFLACGRVLRPGKTLTACQANVYGIEGDGTSTLVATMLSTILIRPSGPLGSNGTAT